MSRLPPEVGGRPPVAGMPTFALHIGLGSIPASLDEVSGEIGDRLDAFEPQLSRQDSDVALSLTIVAADLWVAVLRAMAAVTSTGYPVVQLEARPGPRETTGPDLVRPRG